MAKNMTKYWRHREAWRRIKSANENGYYFEAVTICESIIADRLLSYVLGVSPQSKPKDLRTFSNIIKKWRELTSARPNDTLKQDDDRDLGKLVDDWRNKRNKVVHSLAKSDRSGKTMEIDKFLKLANETAREGENLAKAVKKWQKKRLSEHQRTQKEVN
jgi:hypothetical protein